MTVKKHSLEVFRQVSVEYDAREELPDFDLFDVIKAWVDSAIREIKFDESLEKDQSTKSMANPHMRHQLVRMLALVQTLATHECQACIEIRKDHASRNFNMKNYQDLEKERERWLQRRREMQLRIRELEKELALYANGG